MNVCVLGFVRTGRSSGPGDSPAVAFVSGYIIAGSIHVQKYVCSSTSLNMLIPSRNAIPIHFVLFTAPCPLPR